QEEPNLKRFFRKTTPYLLALALPMCALADLSSTATLNSGQSINLDTGATTGTADLSWNGSALTPQGSAKATVLFSIPASVYDTTVTGPFLQQILTTPGLATSSPIPSSSIPVNTIVAIMDNAGHPAKLLVTAIGSSISFKFTT